MIADELLRRVIEEKRVDLPVWLSDEIHTYLAVTNQSENISSEEVDKSSCIENAENYARSEEPVGWISESGFLTLSDKAVFSATVYGEKFYGNNIPLYLHPPRPMKPMTDEVIEEEIELHNFQDMPEFVDGFLSGISFAERHHGIGGSDE